MMRNLSYYADLVCWYIVSRRRAEVFIGYLYKMAKQTRQHKRKIKMVGAATQRVLFLSLLQGVAINSS